MTLAQLQAAVKGAYALDESTNDAFLTDTQVTRALNRGLRWVYRKSRISPSKWTIDSVNGTREYSLANKSPGIAGISQVLFKRQGTTWTKLDLLPHDQLARITTQFHDEDGAPSHYYTRGDSLGLYPYPDATNAGTGYLEVWGYAFPTALTGANDTPGIDANLHEHLVPPALYELAKQELARGRRDAAGLVALYDRERMDALSELRSYVEMLSDEPQFSNWSLEDF